MQCERLRRRRLPRHKEARRKTINVFAVIGMMWAVELGYSSKRCAIIILDIRISLALDQSDGESRPRCFSRRFWRWALCVSRPFSVLKSSIEITKMRLLTHNLLTSQQSASDSEACFTLEAREVQVRDSPLRPDFIRRLFPTLHWGSLRQAAAAVDVQLPEEVGDELLRDEAFLQAIHHVLFDIHVLEGDLICAETGRRFPIANGIANMRLETEDDGDDQGSQSMAVAADDG
eukprot:scaffold2161_cov244-Pinguiococcus_pyrenoidosus.AAC.18